CYLAVWSGLAFWLRKNGHREAAARTVAVAALPIAAVTISLASFDWLLALTPRWHSTMYGIYVFAGSFGGALGLIGALAPEAVGPSHHHAIGRLLLAFTVFWAYCAFFQYMLIWIGNKPEEVAYYVPRAQGRLLPLTIALVAARFAIPFFALLPAGWKRHRVF